MLVVFEVGSWSSPWPPWPPEPPRALNWPPLDPITGWLSCFFTYFFIAEAPGYEAWELSPGFCLMGLLPPYMPRGCLPFTLGLPTPEACGIVLGI